MIVALNRGRGEDRRESGAVRQCGRGTAAQCGTQQVSRIALVTAFLKIRCHSRRWEFMHEPDHQDYLPPRVFAFDRCPPLAPAVKQSELISAQSFVLGTRNHTQPAELRLVDSMSRCTRSPCDGAI